MTAYEIVPREVQGQGMAVVLDLLREGVGLPGKPTHTYPHIEVHPLDQRRADEFPVGRAGDRLGGGFYVVLLHRY